MKKEIKFEIPIDIWKTNFHVWICKTETAQKWYKDTWYDENDGSSIFKPYHAKTLSSDGIEPIIWVDTSYSKNEIIAACAHEFLHAITYQLRDKGSYFDSDNHEHFTYLLEFCMNEALKKIN